MQQSYRSGLLALTILVMIILAAGCAGTVFGPVPTAVPAATTAPSATLLPPLTAEPSPAVATAATAAPTASAVPTPASTGTSVSTQHPTVAPSVTATSAPRGDIATFTSQALGIRFDYPAALDGRRVGVKETGDKVYVYIEPIQPEAGQWVQVYRKPPAQSLEDAIRQQVLKGVSVQDCQVVSSDDPVAGQVNPPTFRFARIDIPRTPGEDYESLIAKAKKCPQPYAAIGGIAYFLADTAHPDRFLFFSIGQYAIPLGKDRTWQSSIVFLD
jgi:hypothetical protein